MATVFVRFDDEGDTLNLVVIPEDINLGTVRHYSNYSYAQTMPGTSDAHIDEALDFLAQVHALDVKNGVTA